jgi:hypothetical protein
VTVTGLCIHEGARAQSVNLRRLAQRADITSPKRAELDKKAKELEDQIKDAVRDAKEKIEDTSKQLDADSQKLQGKVENFICTVNDDLEKTKELKVVQIAQGERNAEIELKPFSPALKKPVRVFVTVFPEEAKRGATFSTLNEQTGERVARTAQEIADDLGVRVDCYSAPMIVLDPGLFPAVADGQQKDSQLATANGVSSSSSSSGAGKSSGVAH